MANIVQHYSDKNYSEKEYPISITKALYHGNDRLDNILNEILASAKDSIAIVTPQMFGAKGDGVTDDTSAVQSAINNASSNGNLVYFPQGNYLINIAIVKKGVNLVGNNATLINASKTMIMRLYGDNVIDGINLKGQLEENLDFSTDEFKTLWETRYANGWDTLVFSEDVDNITFRNCHISQNLCEGLKFKNASNVLVENCTFKNTDCSVITQGTTAYNVVIRGCTFDGHIYSEKVSLYSTESMNNISIQNNLFKGAYCNTNVIHVGYESSDRSLDNLTSNNIEISGNYIENCVGGIMCITSNKVKIYNNVIENVKTRGIGLSYCSNSEIYNNSISKSNYTGIILSNSTRTDIKNNRITDASYENSSATTGFIRLEDSSYISILYNNFLNIEDNTNKCALNIKGVIDNIVYNENDDIDNTIYLTNASTLTNSKIVTHSNIIGNFSVSLLDSTNIITQLSNNTIVTVGNNTPNFSLGYNQKLATRGIIKITGDNTIIETLTVENLYEYREIEFIVDTTSYGFTKKSSDTLEWKADETVPAGKILCIRFIYKNNKWYEI